MINAITFETVQARHDVQTLTLLPSGVIHCKDDCGHEAYGSLTFINEWLDAGVCDVECEPEETIDMSACDQVEAILAHADNVLSYVEHHGNSGWSFDMLVEAMQAIRRLARNEAIAADLNA